MVPGTLYWRSGVVLIGLVTAFLAWGHSDGDAGRLPGSGDGITLEGQEITIAEGTLAGRAWRIYQIATTSIETGPCLHLTIDDLDAGGCGFGVPGEFFVGLNETWYPVGGASFYFGPAAAIVSSVTLTLQDGTEILAPAADGPPGTTQKYWWATAAGDREVLTITARDAVGTLLESVNF